MPRAFRQACGWLRSRSPSNRTSLERIHPGSSRGPPRRPTGLPSSWIPAGLGAAGMRIGDDVDASWNGIQSPARATALRSFYHRSVWLNDPDCLVVRPPLTLEEARVWASVVATSGGMSIFSDNLPKLPAERLPILQKTIPVAAQTTSAPRPVGTQSDEPEIAPGISAGTTVVRLRGPWRFRTGDDP